ncbi:TLC domain-containing protein 2 [Candoia aspera]|uniref:TLC domain-containing protein 2 n=1 Tax=Candoia aspera TaxID=51853 RepID=UPI002FD82885
MGCAAGGRFVRRHTAAAPAGAEGAAAVAGPFSAGRGGLPAVPPACSRIRPGRRRAPGPAGSGLGRPSMDLLLLGGSVGAFRLLNTVLERLVPPPPPSPAQPDLWKWRNIWTSLAHSLLSGFWALLGFYYYPPMGEDLIDQFSPSAHRLLGLSLGYFVQDFLDMMCNQKLRECWELLFHHSVVIVCFGFAFLIHRFVGFAMVALLVEINSVFLHLRTILLMAGLAHTTSFRLTSLVNLGTYLVFRIMILAWMTRWLVLNRENVPTAPYAMGAVGMVVMLSINIILFCRLLRSDFLPSHKK